MLKIYQIVSEVIEAKACWHLHGSMATHLELLCLLPKLHWGTQWADVFLLDDFRVPVVILHPPALPGLTQHFRRPIHACSVEPRPILSWCNLILHCCHHVETTDLAD